MTLYFPTGDLSSDTESGNRDVWLDSAFAVCNTDDELQSRIAYLSSLSVLSKAELEFQPPFSISNTSPGKLSFRGLVKNFQRTSKVITFLLVENNTDSSSVKVLASVEIPDPLLKELGRSSDEHVYICGVSQEERHAMDHTHHILVSYESGHVLLARRTRVLDPECSETPFGAVRALDNSSVQLPLSIADAKEKLLGRFNTGWFAACDRGVKDVIQRVKEHAAAYRRHGGVIYLGLRKTDKQIQYVGAPFKETDLNDVKISLEDIFKNQRPHCTASGLFSSYVGELMQHLDCAFLTYFMSPQDKRMVVRIVICRSSHPIHLISESQVGLRQRVDATSQSASLDILMARLRDAADDIRHEITRASTSQAEKLSVSHGEPLRFFQAMSEESVVLDNKERGQGEPIKYIKDMLVDYAPAWANSLEGGLLRFGVQDRPPRVTGIFVDEAMTTNLIKILENRFSVNLDIEKDLCFPSLLKLMSLRFYPVHAYKTDFLCGSKGLLVVWLQHKDSPDSVRRELNKLLFSKPSKFSKYLISAPNAAHFLPLKPSLPGLQSPPCSSDSFLPVALSNPWGQLPHDINVDRLFADLEIALPASGIAKLQWITGNLGDSNLLNDNFWVIDASVKASGSGIPYLAECPKVWAAQGPEDVDHIGPKPRELKYQEIVALCESSSVVEAHLDGFFSNHDRPLLITNVGGSPKKELEGLASLPWTLVLDFNFDEHDNLRNVVNETSYVYKVVDLPCHKLMTSQSLQDANCVYWVKALGPASDKVCDPDKWTQGLSSAVLKYVSSACSMLNLVSPKVLIVWCDTEKSDKFDEVLFNICTEISRLCKWRAQFCVISTSLLSTVTQILRRSRNLASKINCFSTNLDALSRIVGTVCPKQTPARAALAIPDSKVQLAPSTARSMIANKLDYVFPGMKNHFLPTKYDGGAAFLEGREKLRWNDLMAEPNCVLSTGPDIEHVEFQVKQKLRERRGYAEVLVLHEPGAGGSTIARIVLWRLHEKYCCVVLNQIYDDLRRDIQELISAGDSRPVVALCDSNEISAIEDVRARLESLSVVVIRVERVDTINVNADHEEFPKIVRGMLPLNALEALVRKLKAVKSVASCSDSALDALVLHARCTNDEIPLFWVIVTALEARFVKLEEYVRERLRDISEEAKTILLRLAFIRHFTNASVAEVIAGDWSEILSPLARTLVAVKHESQYIQLRHSIIDRHVMKLLLGLDLESIEFGKWCLRFGEEVLRHMMISLPDIDEDDTIGDNAFEFYFRRFCHKRQGQDCPYFFMVCAHLCGKTEVLGFAERLLALLPETPNRIKAHFLADTARLHLLFPPHDYDTAIKTIAKAHEAFQKQDRTLLHQEGQLSVDMLKRLSFEHDKISTVKSILVYAGNASSAFQRSQNAPPEGRKNRFYPLISDVDVRVATLDQICRVMEAESAYKLLQNKPFAESEIGKEVVDYIDSSRAKVVQILDELSYEDYEYVRNKRGELLQVLGYKDDFKAELRRVFKVLDSFSKVTDIPQNFETEILNADNLLRSQKHLCRAYPEFTQWATCLANCVLRLIRSRKVRQGQSLPSYHPSRVCELELFWRWSRFSEDASMKQLPYMLQIIDSFLKAIKPSRPNSIGLGFDTEPPKKKSPSGDVLLSEAKCHFYKAVTSFLQVCNTPDAPVMPTQIVKEFDSCSTLISRSLLFWSACEVLCKEKERLGVVSTEAMGISVRHIDRELKGLDQKFSLALFEGCVVERNQSRGLVSLTVGSNNFSVYFWAPAAPQEWKIGEDVRYFLSCSAHGLRAHASPKGESSFGACTAELDDWPVIGERNVGRIFSINKDKLEARLASKTEVRVSVDEQSLPLVILDGLNGRRRVAIGDIFSFTCEVIGSTLFAVKLVKEETDYS